MEPLSWSADAPGPPPAPSPRRGARRVLTVLAVLALLAAAVTGAAIGWQQRQVPDAPLLNSQRACPIAMRQSAEAAERSTQEQAKKAKRQEAIAAVPAEARLSTTSYYNICFSALNSMEGIGN